MSVEDQLARAQQQLHDCAAKIHNQRAEIVRLDTDRSKACEMANRWSGECHAQQARIDELQREATELRQRLAVKCEHPNVETCAKLWQEDTNQRQLADVSPELAAEFPWGCDTVEHLATALLAARSQCQRLGELHREMCGELYGQGFEVAGWHLNGDLEPLDSWFDHNGWLDAETWRPAEKAGEA